MIWLKHTERTEKFTTKQSWRSASRGNPPMPRCDQWKTFAEVIDLWPSRYELARDLGVQPGTVQKWADRNNIRPEYWNRLVRAAKERGFWQVTQRRLSDIAERSATARS